MLMPAQETEWEELIRTGHMTPFGTRIPQKQVKKEPRKVMLSENSGFDKYLTDQAMMAERRKKPTPKKKAKVPTSSTADTPQKNRTSSKQEKKLQKRMRKLQRTALKAHPKARPKTEKEFPQTRQKGSRTDGTDSDGSEYVPSDEILDPEEPERDNEFWQDEQEEYELEPYKKKEVQTKKSKKGEESDEYLPSGSEDEDTEKKVKVKKSKDDGDIDYYRRRIR